MANKKISELTAKGTAIASTDLIEISESDGAGGYVTKSVTGANLVTGSGVHVLTKPVSGRTYNVRIDSATAASSGATGANIIYLSPFVPANTLTVSNFIINVTTLTIGANARMLVYSDVAGVPTTKLLESTNQDCSTTGTRTYTESFTFTAGTTYWLGVYSSAAVTLSTVQNLGLIPISSSAFNACISVLTVGATFGSAPATLGPPTLNTGFPMYIINLTAQ